MTTTADTLEYTSSARNEERHVMARVAEKISLGGDHALRVADELRRWTTRDLLGSNAAACSAGGLELRVSRHPGWYEADMRGRRYAARSKAALLRVVADSGSDWVGLRRREDPRGDDEIQLFNFAEEDPQGARSYALRSLRTWSAANQILAGRERWHLPRAVKAQSWTVEPELGTVAVFVTMSDRRCVYEARVGAVTMLMRPGEAKLLVVPNPSLHHATSHRDLVASAVATLSAGGCGASEGSTGFPSPPAVVVAGYLVVS